jgi:hypothetical protein
MRGIVVLGLVLSLTGCSKISSVIHQGKQAAEAAKQAQQAAKQISQVKSTDDVSKFIRDQQAAQQAKAQAETPQPPADAADVDVQRKDKSSPEINGFIPRFVITGQTTQITMKGSDFRLTDKIESEGICHIKDVKINSSKQVQMTVSVDDVMEGKCKIKVVSAGPNRYENNLDVQLNPDATAKQMAQAQHQMQEQNAHVAQVVGKSWDVKLPSGKSDKWTKSEDGIMGMTDFKDSSGKSLTIAIGKDDAATIMYESCMMQGKIDGNKVVDGKSVLPGCSVGTGAWSATINR